MGLYYAQQKDYLNMMSCFLKSIGQGSVNALVHMGNYYHQQRDYQNMKIYYLLAIDKDSHIAMENLGTYYYSIHDYENMRKYYLMAIEHGNPNAAKYLKQYQEDNNIRLLMSQLLTNIKNIICCDFLNNVQPLIHGYILGQTINATYYFQKYHIFYNHRKFHFIGNGKNHQCNY